MKKIFLNNQSSLLPLYIGITGHRDIRDEDKETLKSKVKYFIEEKKKQCPNTPIVILTPLAEGADRIAAIAAIDCNIDFIAVLPMAVGEYKKDFITQESIFEFEKLIAQASLIIELPLYENTTIEQVSEDSEKRNEQYYQNGLFIARNCHYLIAMWNGMDNGKKGGTADVVKLKKHGIPGKNEDNSKRLRHLQSGPIFHIVTPRKSTNVPENSLTTTYYYSAHFENDLINAKKNDDVMLKHVDSFNKDIIRYSSILEENIKNSSNDLLKNFADVNHKEVLLNIAEKHSIAGELATLFQKRRFLALKVLITLIVFAFLFLHINAEFFHEPTLLLLYPLTMGIGAIWFIIATKKRYEYKHEDYRALSEAYRIQFFMKICDRQDNVSDHYLKRHRGQLEWVLYALRTSQISWLNKNNSISHLENIPLMDRIQFTKISWVDDQLNYFNSKAKKHHNASRKYERFANISFIMAILSACILFLITSYKDMLFENFEQVEKALHPTLSCSTSIFLVLAAALHGYSEKMVFSEQSKNYQQMAQLFKLASDKLEHAIETIDQKEANDIIGELAQEALLENGDWLLLHRSRPLEIPKG